jgi:hypothetical protein
MSKIDNEIIYRAVLETLTNNYTVNLFSSLERENLAKKVAYRLDVIMGKDNLNNETVTTHMGDQIIQRENKTDDLLTEEKAKELEKTKKPKKVVKRNIPKKKNPVQKPKIKSGLQSLKK